MIHQNITVLKLGSSILKDRDALPSAVHEIYRYLRRGHRVVAVVSAFEGTTDRLFADAKRLETEPDPFAIARLVATGEAEAAAHLVLALDRAGVPGEALDAARLGLGTRGGALDAEPAAFDPAPILAALGRVPVVVVPGFVGNDDKGRTTLLGRGGSDLSALVIASRLQGASCRLVKDVDGIFERDPSSPGPPPRAFTTITPAQAHEIGGGIVQAKALRFAEAAALPFRVARLLGSDGTEVRSGGCVLGAPREGRRRITVLGMGTVGMRVLAALRRHDELFEIAAVAARAPGMALAAGIDPSRIHTNVDAALRTETDIVIELIGGEEPARRVMAESLRDGRNVVTANKLVVAAHGPALARIAADRDVRFEFSAAVGGGVPMLEAVRCARPHGIARLAGVLNGTASFILERIERGDDLATALTAARALGFAEADPSDDLRGLDAVRKILILARAAFGGAIEAADFAVNGLENVDPDAIRTARRRGLRTRLVARAASDRHGRISGTVHLEELPSNDALASGRGAWNVLEITRTDGVKTGFSGRGAGGLPAAEAVFGDALEILHDHAAIAPAACEA